MWKKMGNIHADNCRSARSHLTKDEEPFLLFHHPPPTQHPQPPEQPTRKNFCEDYIKRHHSADKPQVSNHSRIHSEKSLAPSNNFSPAAPADLFSLLRSHDLPRRKESLEMLNSPIHDRTAELARQLYAFRGKWKETQQKVRTLKKKQGELREQVKSELSKWKKAVDNAFGEVRNHAMTRRDTVVSGALEDIREHRRQQEKWKMEREGILRRFNTTIDRLI